MQNTHSNITTHALIYMQPHVQAHSLSDLDEATGSSCMEGCPALIVPPVYTAAALHKKLHHLSILINTSLQGQRE